MQPTTTPDPATALVARNRPAFAAALLLAAVLCLIPTIRYGMRAFTAPTPATEAKEQDKDDLTALDKSPAAADPNRADHATFALAGALGTLLCLGGGLWAAFAVPPPTDEERTALARRALLVLGSGLGLLAMLLGLAMFYLWFESLTKWLNDGETAQAKWVLVPVAVFLAGAGLMFLSVQPARAEERSDQSLRRLVYAVNLGLTAFLLFAVLLIGNVFASLRVPNRLDTTESGFYTLDPKTEAYLAKLDQPVTAYATLPEGSGRAIDDARRLLTAAQEINPGKFKVKFLSLSLNKDEITRLKGKYPQADLNEYGVLLTAGENEERSAFLRESDLVKQEGGGFGAPQRVSFTGESSLVREVMFLTDPGGKPVIYFTQGRGELEVVPAAGGPLRGGARTANQLRTVLEKGYAEVKAWQPEPTNPKVPADCTVLVVADPLFPLPKETADAIRAYMTEPREGGKKGKLVVLAGANPKLEGGGITDTGLDGVLAELNVRLGNKLIIGRPTSDEPEWNRHICGFNPRLAAANSIAQAYLGRGFRMSDVRTVEPVGGGPPGMGGPVTAEPLMITEPGRFTLLETEMPKDPVASWNDTVKNRTLREAKEFSDGPRIVAVVASEGATNRAVVIGSGSIFADPTGRQRASSAPGEFFANLVDWLRDRPAAAAVANKTYGEYVPSKSADTFRLYFLPVGLTLLAVLALGAGVWVVRRK